MHNRNSCICTCGLTKCAHTSSFAAVFTLARQKIMSLQKYLKATLPTSQETGLGVSTTKTANERVQNVLDAGGEKSEEADEQTVYSDEDQAAIGKHATESRNTSTAECVGTVERFCAIKHTFTMHFPVKPAIISPVPFLFSYNTTKTLFWYLLYAH